MSDNHKWKALRMASNCSNGMHHKLLSSNAEPSPVPVQLQELDKLIPGPARLELLMRRVAVIPAAFLGLCLWLAPVARAPKPLQIYFIDVEGGKSTLIVAPPREELRVDTHTD